MAYDSTRPFQRSNYILVGRGIYIPIETGRRGRRRRTLAKRVVVAAFLAACAWTSIFLLFIHKT
jgi:hypothetical protein